MDNHPTSSFTKMERLPPILTAWNLPGLRHGFLDRRAGFSQNGFSAVNPAPTIGNNEQSVGQDYRRWHQDNTGLRPVCLRQVHGSEVRIIDTASDSAGETGDGMVTARAGIALCIFSADCVPVLLVDPGRGIAGALHAGWRGTLKRIAQAGVRAMIAMGARPEAVRAALGPAIGGCCFEVDEDLAASFAEALPESRRHQRPGRAGKAYLDLRLILRDQLQSCGVAANGIELVGPCTRCANDRYFSRRAARGAITGLQMSFIGFAH